MEEIGMNKCELCGGEIVEEISGCCSNECAVALALMPTKMVEKIQTALALLNRVEAVSGGPLDAVIEERIRQDAKWGEQNHEPLKWLSILMEEVGELALAVNETIFDNGTDARAKGGLINIRREAVQCSAVALALVECIDRNAPKQNGGGK
jgi:NTP pyrophosphatase (non-canonical NTP hydrolase)